MKKVLAIFKSAESVPSGKELISFFINGRKYDAEKGTSVYDATRTFLPKHQRVPTLCHHPYVDPDANCNICYVECKTENGIELLPACNTQISEGMEIYTDTPAVNDNIQSVLKGLLSSHPLDCPTCDVNTSCDFQDLLAKYGIGPKDLTGELAEAYLESLSMDGVLEWGNNAITLDTTKCIECSRCVRVCRDVMEMNILEQTDDKGEKVGWFNVNTELDLLGCIGCGQCSFVCPTGAIRVNTDVTRVNDWLKQSFESDDIVIAQTAPAVRVTIAEDLNLAPGAVTEGQMVAGMKAMGFDYVFDTNFTADLTILEEGMELIERVKSGGPFPMFTSCCPSWINLAEKYYPEYLDNLSTCKSPQQMLGALIKHYWAEKAGVDKSNVKVVSIMPCTAKKDECVRPNMDGDVDVVLTTRELARLYKLNNVDVASLPDEKYDDPLGKSTGAAVIFGATGGVMEAAVRTAYEIIVGEPLPDINFTTARGLDGLREATVEVGGIPLKIAIAHQGKNIHEVLRKVKAGEEYHFIEIMCCPGGCIGGGGNPKVKNHHIPTQDRSDAIYKLDEENVLRKSHENPSVIELYEEFLERPLGHHSHELLHTTYTDRSGNK